MGFSTEYSSVNAAAAYDTIWGVFLGVQTYLAWLHHMFWCPSGSVHIKNIMAKIIKTACSMYYDWFKISFAWPSCKTNGFCRKKIIHLFRVFYDNFSYKSKPELHKNPQQINKHSEWWICFLIVWLSFSNEFKKIKYISIFTSPPFYISWKRVFSFSEFFKCKAYFTNYWTNTRHVCTYLSAFLMSILNMATIMPTKLQDVNIFWKSR